MVEAEPVAAKLTSAQIRKSIKDDGLISFEDGKTYQTLKRHLSRYDMTFAQYKAKWGLPTNYPSTAPGYSARRSEMAKSLGLGTRTKTAPVTEPKASRKAKPKATA